MSISDDELIRELVTGGLDERAAKALLAKFSASAPAPKWAVFRNNDIGPLTNNVIYRLTAADLVLMSDDGSGNFTVVEGGSVEIHSAVPGRFRCAAYLDTPADATLAGSDTHERKLWFGAVGSGDLSAGDLNSMGMDHVFPVLPGLWNAQWIVHSTPTYLSVPGRVFSNFSIQGLNLVAGDSVPIDSYNISIAVWLD